MRRGKRRQSIHSIVVRPLFLFLVIAWVVMCLFSYVQLCDTVEKKTRDGVLYGLSQRMLLLNKRLEDMESNLRSVTAIARNEMWSLLHNVSYYRRGMSKQRLDDALSSQNTRYENMCVLIDKENSAFLIGSSHLMKEEVKEMTERMLPVGIKDGYTLYHPFFYKNASRLMLSFDFGVGSVKKRETITAVALTDESIDDLLNEKLSEADQNPLLSGHVYLTDADGAPLQYPVKSEQGFIRILSQPNLYGICLCYEISPDIYYAERYSELVKMTVIMAAGLIAAVLIASGIVRRIRRPIRQITDTIENLQLGRPLDGALCNSTNIVEYDMILHHTVKADQRIRQTMETVLTLEKEKHDKDIMLLRMQINPHFLYNALNAVQWMARCNKARDIEEYMQSLLYILHYNLDRYDDHLVLLEKEISLAQAYIRICQSRYDNRIRFDVIGDGHLPVTVPRFILQPLVENAIYHGLR